jgi:hypothetical protein
VGFPPKPNEFINYEKPMWAIVQWRNVIAFNTVVTWLRLFKYLRFVPFMRLLIGTISSAAGQVAAFLSMFFIIFWGFTLAYPPPPPRRTPPPTPRPPGSSTLRRHARRGGRDAHG